MSDIEWSPWIRHEGEDCPFAQTMPCQVAIDEWKCDKGMFLPAKLWSWRKEDGVTHYRIPMEDYKRITGMPDWSEAPEWAQWLAQDKGGEWFFFLDKPRMDDLIEIWDADETHAYASSGADLGDWRDTLQKRPSDQLESHPNSELDADECSVVADTVEGDGSQGLLGELLARGTIPLQYDPADVKFDSVSQTDSVNMPSHYTSGEIECIDAIQAQMTPEQFAGYLRGTCVAYIWRYQHKGGKESLLKAQWYLNRLIDVVE